MVGEAGVKFIYNDDPAGHFGKANVGLIFGGVHTHFCACLGH